MFVCYFHGWRSSQGPCPACMPLLARANTDVQVLYDMQDKLRSKLDVAVAALRFYVDYFDGKREFLDKGQRARDALNTIEGKD